MSGLLEEIKEGLDILPLKDKNLCLEFIDTRRIDALKEIVDSNVIKTTKQLKKTNNLQCEEDLENLNLLKNNVDSYYLACGYLDNYEVKDELEIEDDEEYYGEY